MGASVITAPRYREGGPERTRVRRLPIVFSSVRFSVIVPLYNRPEKSGSSESLVKQTYKDFEVLVVEDGSERDARESSKGFRIG